MALWPAAASVIVFSMQAVDNARTLSMTSSSQRYAESGGASDELFQALAGG